MTKYQKILSGILVLQIVLVGWVFWPKEPANSQREPLLGDLKVDEIVDLRITDESGKTIHFSRVGQDWTLPEAGDYPVDGEKIQNLLDNLVKVNTGSLVAETETSHKQLQVGDETYARKVELGMAGGSQTGFFVGSSAGASTAHILKFGDSNVYLTDALTSYELGTTGSGWIDTAYVNVPSTTVNRFVIRNASGELVFEKDASGGWQMQGLEPERTVMGSSVDRLVGAAAAMRMVEPVAKEADAAFGLGDPAAVVVLIAKDEAGAQSEHEILIGSQDPKDNNYYAHYSGSDYYVKISAYTAEQFIDAARDDFLEAQATPTSASAN